MVSQVFITLESTPDSMFRTETVKYALIGLMRDLRGITMATNRQVLLLVFQLDLGDLKQFSYDLFVFLLNVFQSQNFWSSFWLALSCTHATSFERHFTLVWHTRGKGYGHSLLRNLKAVARCVNWFNQLSLLKFCMWSSERDL